MSKALSLLLAVCVTPILVFSAANPFAGTWKFNQEKSDSKGLTFSVASLGENKFRFTLGTAQDFVIKADGTDQTSVAGTTWAITIKDPNTWEQVVKVNGKKMGSASWVLSADGNSQTYRFTGIRPDGSQDEGTQIFKRVAGSGGFVGTWQRTGASESKPSLLQIDASSDGNLAVSWPSDQTSMKVTLDGKDFAVEGPQVSKGAMASAKRTGALSLQTTDKLNGKVMATTDWAVSADGKILSLTEHIPGVAKASVSVYDRH
jgi:hypothetical protein